MLGYLVTLFIAVYAVIVMLYSVWLPHEKLTITGSIRRPSATYCPTTRPGGSPFCSAVSTASSRTRDMDVTSRQICERAPYNSFSQVTDAATLWQEITKWGPLTVLHPAIEKSC